ncbi:MAG TPA: hypothetical protein VII72_15715 [Myxococcota bacterium]
MITSVGADWNAFAAANDGAALTGSRVVGRSLFDFIAGDETRRIYQLLLRRVRALDAPILLPFRCDSPDARRHMRLEIRPGRERGVEFRGVCLRSETRRHLRLVSASEPRPRALLVSCSFCLLVQVPPKSWLEAEDAVVRLRLLDGDAPPRLVYGVCPACKTRLGEASGGAAPLR